MAKFTVLPKEKFDEIFNRASDDCVSRQVAIDALDEIESEIAEGFGFEYEKWRKYFCDLPPAQPKRGRWIGKYTVTSVCSECGFLIHDSKVKAFAYCPNCGADMRGEDNEID